MKVRVKTKSAELDGKLTYIQVVTAAAVLLILVSPLSHGVTKNQVPAGPKTILPAVITARQNSTAVAELVAQVESIHVFGGARVKAGDLLVVLRSGEVRKEIAAARLRWQKAQARVTRLEGPRANDLRVQIGREQRRAAAKAREAAHSQVSEFSVEYAERIYAQAKAKTGRVRGLLQQQLATADELEQVEREELQAYQAVRAAREQLLRLEQAADTANSNLRLVDMQLELQTGSELAAARTEMEDAKTALDAALTREKSLQVRASREATVLAVNVSVGDRVFAGTCLVQLADLSLLNVDVPLSASLARQIPRGLPVAVRVPTDPPQELPAEVSEIVLVPDSRSQSYLVRVTIPNPEPGSVLAGLDGAVVFSHLNTKQVSWVKRLF